MMKTPVKFTNFFDAQDCSAELQQAVQWASDNGPRDIRFDGLYRFNKVDLKPGVGLVGGMGTVFKQLDPNGASISETKWWRMLRCLTADFDTDDKKRAGLRFANLAFDGNQAAMGPFDQHEQEQAHGIFLHAAPGATRLFARMENLDFYDFVAAGFNCYAEVDLQASRLTGYNCFRGVVNATGGNNWIDIDGLMARDKCIDFEPNSSAHGPLDVIVRGLFSTGKSDFALRGSDSRLTLIAPRVKDWNMYGDGQSSLKVHGGWFDGGPRVGHRHRFSYPGEASFNDTTFLIRYDPAHPDAKLTGIDIYTHKPDAFPDRVEFNNCNVRIVGDIPEGFAQTIIGITVQASKFDQDNIVIVNGGSIEDARFTHGIWMNRGPKLQIGNGTRINAQTALHLGHDQNYQGHFRIGDIILGPDVQTYAFIGNPQTFPIGDNSIIEHRGTVVRDGFALEARGRVPPDEWFRGSRTIEGTDDPTVIDKPGLRGDEYHSGSDRWVCTVPSETAATWVQL